MAHSGTTVTMQGYVSRFAGDEEWPDVYVIVRVEPEAWMATLELNELRAVVEGREDGPVRGVRCERVGGRIRLELGRAHVTGSRENWLGLAARLRDNAGSAEELFDVPRAWPWDGPVVELAVDDVVVPGSRETFGGELSVDELLTEAGGFDDETWRDTFGVGWRTAERSDLSGDFVPVFLWGEPPQIAAAISPDGGLLLGRPGGRFEGHAEWWWGITDPVAVCVSQPLPMVESFVRELLRRRRRTFAWCRYCGSHVAPEARFDTNVCDMCATAVLGVVY